tara:strand:- start:493 stop:690 length:198 start_codon:yes stop_codon:yes gene_type:complete
VKKAKKYFSADFFMLIKVSYFLGVIRNFCSFDEKTNITTILMPKFAFVSFDPEMCLQNQSGFGYF